MAAIDDALSSARSAHYGVIGTCVAALLFAATPDLGAPYRAARRDLGALRSIKWEDGRKFLITEGVKMRGDSAALWSDFVTRANGFEGVREGLFRPLDLAWDEFPTLPEVTPQTTVGELISLGSAGAVKVRRARVLRSAPLHQVAPVCFPTAAAPKPHICALEVNRSSDSIYEITVSHSPAGIKKKLGELRMQAGDIHLSKLMVRDWIKKAYPNEGLFGSAADSAAFVPKLAAVQREIADLTPTQAAGVLDEKIAGRERHLSAGGFSVGGNFVTLVGPVLLILTLMYLSFQINHLTRLAPGNEKAICDFAWPLTFRGFPGMATAVVTLLLLPATAVLLLRTQEDSVDAFSLRGAGAQTWVLLVMAVGAGIACLVARNRLAGETERNPQ